ncbi:type II toxin-antitoxin system Phd/YefM family antitoxin [Brevibacterium aurantiacum]|uniref:Type II toxin-antitoxin system Phd/YefM family antitoxin n=1 Tax=Brevibacterium aurantiacum TaxID=273384 RepID=A0A556C544_BREAU|nr:type II toxin-antitoxin system prevent-host-death family antitoxin [Brevibacterium aurantiacum]TSI12446.1 type II toxin-antitoxin system Phd/YefM family antitoxin [Brevibacterium aurantiacum]
MTNLTITEASKTGISGLVSSAESGEEVTLSRHGEPVAAVVSTHELAGLREDRESLNAAALVMARIATDSGTRTDLDQAMEYFGIERADLEAEIDAGHHTL